EADGEQHHETVDDALIPEDVYRQDLLEQVGWVFHRVRFTDFRRDPDGHIAAIVAHLTSLPADPRLAEQVWGGDAVSVNNGEWMLDPPEAWSDLAEVELLADPGTETSPHTVAADGMEQELLDVEDHFLADAGEDEDDEEEFEI